MPKETVVSNTAPTGTPGTTLWFDTSTNFLKYWNGSAWTQVPVGAASNGVPTGGTAGQLLAKNSATDYDDGWTSDLSVSTVSASGNINSTGQNTFGQLDMRRNNAGGAVAALQNVGTFRGLGWDGVSAYQVLGAISFPAEQTVSPSQAGGAIQFQTTPNGAIGTVARMRVGQNGKVQIPGAMQLGQAVLTDPMAGTILDLSNGLLAQRRQGYAIANGNNNDLAVPTSTFVEFIGNTAASTITGFAGGVDGAVIDFLYLGVQTITITHQTTSVAANQTYTMSGANETLTGPCSGTLRYDSSVSKWILVTFLGKPQSGSVVQEKSMYIAGAWGSGAVTAYTSVGNQPAGWGTLTKKYTGTTMVIEFGCSCWIITAANVLAIGVSPTNSAGNVTKCGQFFFNEVGTHRAFTGMATIGGGIGAYTYTAWVQLPAGSSLSSDTNDWFWMKVREVWP